MSEKKMVTLDPESIRALRTGEDPALMSLKQSPNHAGLIDRGVKKIPFAGKITGALADTLYAFQLADIPHRQKSFYEVLRYHGSIHTGNGKGVGWLISASAPFTSQNIAVAAGAGHASVQTMRTLSPNFDLWKVYDKTIGMLDFQQPAAFGLGEIECPGQSGVTLPGSVFGIITAGPPFGGDLYYSGCIAAREWVIK